MQEAPAAGVRKKKKKKSARLKTTCEQQSSTSSSFFGQALRDTPLYCCSHCNRFRIVAEESPKTKSTEKSANSTRSVIPQKEAEKKLRAWRSEQGEKMGSLWGDELVMTDTELSKIAKEAPQMLLSSDVPVAPQFQEEVWGMLAALTSDSSRGQRPKRAGEGEGERQKKKQKA